MVTPFSSGVIDKGTDLTGLSLESRASLASVGYSFEGILVMRLAPIISKRLSTFF